MKIIPPLIFVVTIMLLHSLVPGLQAVTYSSEVDWSVVYDATSLPNTAGSIHYSNGTTGSFGTAGNIANLNTQIIDGNVLSFDTKNSGWYTLATNQDRFFINTDTGYTVEYRARLLSAYTNETSRNFNSAGLLDMNDGRSGINKFWSLGFGADYESGELFVHLSGGKWIYIGSDWITYTVTVQGNTATLYMDGVSVDSVNLQGTATGEVSRWGNLRGATIGAHFEVESLKIYDQGAIPPIPEPGHIGAGIALIALALALWRSSALRRSA